jgi:hypothetical protein
MLQYLLVVLYKVCVSSDIHDVYMLFKMFQEHGIFVIIVYLFCCNSW